MTDRAKILLVDDRPENLLALEAILSSLDQVLVRAGSGEEALRALLKDDFALILLDAQMPGMDGFETAATIKRRSRTKDVPIIFLTAVEKDQQSSYRGYAAGAADYISKPFDPWVLRAKVQVFVDLWKARRRLATQASLLRDELEGAGGTRLLGALRDRAAAVEEASGRVVSGFAASDEADVTDSVRQLRASIEALLDALSVLEDGARP